jgi:hypothetical protein
VTLSSFLANHSSLAQVVNGSRQALPEKGGDFMNIKYFKITRSWVVKAEDETEAFKLVSSDQAKYLESETVSRTEYKKPQVKTGWSQSIKNQVLGSNSKR